MRDLSGNHALLSLTFCGDLVLGLEGRGPLGSGLPDKTRPIDEDSKQKAVYWGKKTVILFILFIRSGSRDSLTVWFLCWWANRSECSLLPAHDRWRERTCSCVVIPYHVHGNLILGQIHLPYLIGVHVMDIPLTGVPLVGAHSVGVLCHKRACYGLPITSSPTLALL
jgi:hypothetical protein